MDAEDNDRAIVARVRNGDKRAFNLLVSKYQYRLRALISRFISDAHEQEDVVQEAFIKAYRAIGNFRGDSAFYTWLYRIAVNTAKNHLASAARQPAADAAQSLDADADADADGDAPPRMPPRLIETTTPDAVLHNDRLVAAIEDAIAALPAELRQAITLRELDGLRYEDIAAVMDCPIGTVRSRIFRAREAIQEAMAPLMD